jgi:hypothetical protein
MIKRYYVMLWFKEAVETHEFFIPCSGPGSYRQHVSLASFNEREAAKSCGDVIQLHAMVLSEKEWEQHHAFEARSRQFETEPCEEPPPHFVHEDIWQMYQAIGYDYKRQKYTRKPPEDVDHG